MSPIDPSSPLHDVLACPTSDAARLVYADWLDEHGTPAQRAQAEFIRLQVSLHHDEPGYTLDLSRSIAVHERSGNPMIRRALDALREMWLLGKPWPWSDWPRLEWSRGFVVAHRGTLAVVMEDLPHLVLCHPVTLAESSDRAPMHMRDGRYGWTYPAGNHETVDGWPETIPRQVWRLLKGYVMADLDFIEYASRPLAVAALSRALLAWAKDESLVASLSSV